MWLNRGDYFENTACTLSEEWIQARWGRITGHSLTQLPADGSKMLERFTFNPNAFGIREEESAVEKYVDTFKLFNWRQPGFVIPNPHSERYSWLPEHLHKALVHIGGTPDVITPGLKLVAEIKCKQPQSKSITNIYPSHYTQLMFNTGLMSYTRGDYFVVQPDGSIYTRRFSFDPKKYSELVMSAVSFAHTHLQPHVTRGRFQLPPELENWYWS